MGRDPRESAAELRAVAPMVVTGKTLELVGPCTLVTNGKQTIAFSSAEMLRQAGEPLAIALTFDGKRTLPITSWTMGRHAGMGIIELGAPFPDDKGLDVQPLKIESVYATVDTRGAPSNLVTVAVDAKGVFSRRIIPVHVDAVDGGGMADDIITRLASPDRKEDVDAPADGGALFSWLPPDPVLGRPSEVVVVALGLQYRMRTFKPRALPALAELLGLEDLGRALPWELVPPEEPNLGQVAGELSDDESGPIDVRDIEGD